jgi:hypothetical protein
MMITRGVKEWYLASLQDDDHSWSKRIVVPFFYSTSDHHSVRMAGTILLLQQWSSSCKDARSHSFASRVIIILWGRQVPFFYSTSDCHSVKTPGTILFLHEWTWRPQRMMITRGVKERYLASLEDDDHSCRKVMVPGVLTGWWSFS